MLRLLKFGLTQDNLSVIFQNKDDYKEVKLLGVLSKKNKTNFIKGSGVDLKKFYHSEFRDTGKIKILFPVRMLWDKGVDELRKASEILKEKYSDRILFILSGLADIENKAGVTEEYLKDWEEEGYVEWIGYQKNMVDVYQNSDIVVLPSYREGMPKSLIEACAIGRPIVTTNAIGCRECVEEGENGYKVPVKSVKELANALEKLILSEKDKIRMGNYSRKKAEIEFSQKKVIEKHLKIYSELNA
jgi:glycosyltransferase involved in cell wall biosynthesis